jgi:hypothetical protein
LIDSRHHYHQPASSLAFYTFYKLERFVTNDKDFITDFLASYGKNTAPGFVVAVQYPADLVKWRMSKPISLAMSDNTPHISHLNGKDVGKVARPCGPASETRRML